MATKKKLRGSTRTKAIAASAVAAIPDQPEILKLWTRVASWRAVLVELLTEHLQQDGPIYARYRKILADIEPNIAEGFKVEDGAELRAGLDRMANRQVAEHAQRISADLTELDTAIAKAAYSPAKLRRLTEAARESQLRDAFEALKKFAADKHELERLVAQRSLGRLMEPPTDGSDIDLVALFADAQAWRVAKNRSGKDVLRHVVAAVTATTPNRLKRFG